MGDERQRRDRGSAPPTPDAIAPQRHATSLPGPIVALQRSAGNRVVRSLLAAAPTKLTVVPSHELTHVVQQRPAAVARRPFDAVIRRVQWTDASVTLTASLSAELRNGLAQAMADPAGLPAGPQWLRNRLIQEDNLDLAAKAAGTSYADNANEAWNRLKPPAQARLDE